MPPYVSLALTVLGSIAWGIACPCASAQERRPPNSDRVDTSGAPADSQLQKQKLRYFHERLAKLSVAAVDSPQQPFRFVDDPLITFENPVSQMWDGFMFVWTDRGRPAAVAKCYYHSLNKRWGRTFVSLSDEKIEMSQEGKKLWTPAEAGLSFAVLPAAPKPAEDARRRLTQMRGIARRFTMVDHWGLKDPTDWQLRLLPAPLFRYQAPEHGVEDGALFGYVVNSPEALVLIEARKTDEGLAWHYAVARFTRFEVTVSLDAKQIANFPRLESWPPSGVYFHDPVELPDYPFQRTTTAPRQN